MIKNKIHCRSRSHFGCRPLCGQTNMTSNLVPPDVFKKLEPEERCRNCAGRYNKLIKILGLDYQEMFLEKVDMLDRFKGIK